MKQKIEKEENHKPREFKMNEDELTKYLSCLIEFYYNRKTQEKFMKLDTGELIRVQVKITPDMKKDLKNEIELVSKEIDNVRKYG